MVFPGIEDTLLKLLVAVALGAVIGFEREIHGRPAGLRTHILICLGSTLFALVSLGFAAEESARIAAGIITGIGFLGAGSIFKSDNNISGLTTAADIWVIAGVGIAIGLGFYSAAIIVTIIAFLTLFLGARKFQEEIQKKKK